MSGAPQPETQAVPTLNRGRVKQALSGDTIVIRGLVAKGGPPPEKTFGLSSLIAPKLAKRPQAPGPNPDEDEPYAWEAREFLRKKLIGQTILFTPPKEKAANQVKEHGTVYLDHGNGVRENINELMVREGLVNVRVISGTKDPVLQKLIELQEEAKSAKRGKWSEDGESHVRQIKWQVESDKMLNFVDKTEKKPIKAVIEHVRDGSTIRAFLLMDAGDFTYITLMMSGIRCPANKLDSEGKPDPTKVDFADEAKYFTETRLLQQEVEIVLDCVNNNNFVGKINHPKGDISEELLKNGYAHCVDWSIGMMKKSDIDRMRQAEKTAKEKRLRFWKDWTPPPTISDKEFSGTVVEVINGDALMIKLPNGNTKKIFLASIRPPREQNAEGGERPPQRGGRVRPLYDVPWMFEAREYLRKKLIGKKVNVTVDYIQPARESLPEKSCCTVTISSVNIAEALVGKGLATVVRHRQNDDQRASAYDSLLAAENKAAKSTKGVHAKKDIPVHRVNDITADPAKAKNLLPHIMRNSRIEALVEFVVNGSRMRLYVPKDSHLITFLLSGIEVRCDKNAAVNTEEAALQFTRERCMQREVEIQVEGTDRIGNFIGWLWVDNVNLSVALVEAGLAKIHTTGENSRYSKDLYNAKNTAKAKGLWKYEEKEERPETIEEDKTPDRKTDFKEVYIVEVSESSFYCQYTNTGGKLNSLQAKMAQEMAANPPLPGAYSPKRGDICAAKYPADSMWYRAKVEKVSGNKANVFYIDYGNRSEVQTVNCAPLPSGLDINTDKPYANLYSLAFVSIPKEPEDAKAAEAEFREFAVDNTVLLNYEYEVSGAKHATLHIPETEKEKEKVDIGKSMVAYGFLLVSRRKEKRFEKVMVDYNAAQDEAKKKHLGIWEYGDIRDDDDKEFGMGRQN